MDQVALLCFNLGVIHDKFQDGKVYLLFLIMILHYFHLF